MNFLNKHRWGQYLLIALLLCGAHQVYGQVDTGSLSGTVTDSSGSVVSGAAVVATEQGSGTVYKTVTSGSGGYTFPSLRTGTYTVTVTAPTFSVQQVTDLPVDLTRRSSHDFALAPGRATETVNVVANGPTLETETSDIGTVLSPEQVEDLPLAVTGVFRSVQSLSFLAPGAVGPGTNGGTFQSKIAGGQTLGSEYLIDGISTYRSENGSGNFDQTTPSVDSIEEFRVETASLPAEFGRTTGGIANLKTRSGTNTYHGHLYDFFKNNGLDANTWFNNGYIAKAGNTPAAQKQFKRFPDTKNDYGATLGGPVRIPFLYKGNDRTFFFFNFEQLKYHGGGLAATTVPTAAQRGGDFSSTLGGATTTINPCTGLPLLQGQLFDPGVPTQNVASVDCRTTAFAGNKIDPSRFSPLALKILALIPMPTPGYVGTGTNNYVQSFTSTTTNTDYSLRLDQNFGSRHHVFGYVSGRENSNNGSPNLPEPIDNTNVSDQFYKYARVGWDFTITPHLVNSLTIGGNRVNSFNSSQASFSRTVYDAQLGIPNSAGAGFTFPSFSFGEPQFLGLGNSNYDDNTDNALIGNEAVSWQFGAHTVRFGGTYRWQQFSYNNNGTASGSFNFGRSQTAGSANSGVITGNGFASFLLGAPGNLGRTIQLHAPRWLQPYYAAFVEDDWKVRRNLTLNLGLRYSIDHPRYEAEGASSNFDPNLPNPGANGILGALAFSGTGTGRSGNSKEGWANTYFKNFEPRVGFAYTPGWLHDAVVLRGAYTMISGPLEYADYGQGLSAGFTQGHSHNSNSINPFSSLDAGFPASDQYVVNTDPSQRNGTQIDAVLRGDGRPATVQNWSLETQTQLAPDLIFTLGYIGQHTVRLHSYVYEENNIPQSALQLGDLLFAPANSPQAVAAGIKIPFANFNSLWGGGANVARALAPFPQFDFMSNDNYLQNRGMATYHAMEAKLERRFRNGLNLLASYTWSKTMTDADSIQPFFATLLGQGGTQNPYNLKAEKAVSNQDVPNNFVVSYLYTLPIGHGQKFLSHTPKAVDLVLGGWRVGGVQRYLSGQPVSFYGGTSGPPGFYFGIRPNRVAGQSLYTAVGKSGKYNPFDTTQRIFNGAAFHDPNDPAIRKGGPWQFGNMSRNVTEYRTPASLNEDLSLNKTFAIHDQFKMDFRAEMFNAFNRHIFNKPGTGITDGNFGQIGSTLNGPRNIQLVLKIQY
jgi:hypothetical protein